MFRISSRTSFLVAIVYWSSGLAHSQTPATTESTPPGAVSNSTSDAVAASSSDSSNIQRLHFQLIQMLERLNPYRHTEEHTGKVTLSGSTTMSDLGHQWAQNFKQFHPKVEFSGTADGSEEALKLLAENPTIIAGVSRPVDESDRKMLMAGKCEEPIAITVGLEAMALFVNKFNPLESVSPEVVKTIFAENPDPARKTKVWGDVGIEGAFGREPIVIYERGPSSGSQAFISRVLLAGVKIEPTMKPCETNTEICTSIASDPKGVGFADIRYEHPNVRRVPLLVQGQVVQANEFNVLTGKYPIVRPLVLVLDKAQLPKDGKIRESILRYVLSRDGQAIVMKAGFFPLDPGFIHQQLTELFGEQLR